MTCMSRRAGKFTASDVECKEKYACTKAWCLRHDGVLQVLIGHEATVNVVNHWNLTPLATAVISNQHATAQLLREHGARLCSKMHTSFYPVHAATINGTSPLFAPGSVNVLLHAANIKDDA